MMRLMAGGLGGRASVRVRVDGADKLRARLAKFGEGVAKKALRKALAAAGKPIVKAVKAEAPKASGVLRQSIRQKVLISKRTKKPSLRIGAQSKKVQIVSGAKRRKYTKSVAKRFQSGKIGGRRVMVNPAKYSHLVALGTKRGVKATDYLRKGLSKARSGAMSEFNKVMKHEVQQAAREAERKFGG